MAHSISTSSSSVSVTTSDSSRLCSFSIVQFSFQSDTITLTEYGDICKGKSIDISGKKDTIKEKIETIAREIYGAKGVNYTTAACKQIEELEKFNLDKLPICMAKTQYSLSDNPSLLGRPEGFDITVKEVRVSNGAGFIVALTGDIMTMPGLPKVPAANRIDILPNGEIVGLF